MKSRASQYNNRLQCLSFRLSKSEQARTGASRRKSPSRLNRPTTSNTLRRERGQGLVEGACAISMITMLFVFLLAFGVNVYTVITYDSVLRLVAAQSAQAYEDHQYWLGMNRPDYSADQATADATHLAIALAELHGVTLDPGNVAFKPVTLNIPYSSAVGSNKAPIFTTGVTCSVSMDKLQLPFGGGIFPLMVKREVSATVANMSIPAPAYVDLYTHTRDGSATSISMPAYFAYKPGSGENQTLFDSHGDPTYIGRGSAQAGATQIGNIRANTYYGLRLPEGTEVTNPRDTVAGTSTVQAR